MPRTISDLDAWLRQFDGKKRDTLLKRVEDFPADAALLGRLVGIAEYGDPQMQNAAIALLKAHQTKGVALSERVAGRLLDLLPTLVPWEAKLVVLQMLPALPILSSHADSLCDCLHAFLVHSNKFIRAWAYSGLHRLAFLYPDYRAVVAPLLDAAAKKESASVRARLRQLTRLIK